MTSTEGTGADTADLTGLSPLSSGRAAILPEVGLAAFCSGADDPGGLELWMRSVLASGSVRPEWCFAALDESGGVVAAQCWWGAAGSTRPRGVDALWAARTGAAVALLEAARRRLDPGETRAVVTAPMEDGDSARSAHPEVVSVLEQAGFAFAVARVQVEWGGGELPAGLGRLSMRPARELEENVLVELFAAVAEGSLDHGMVRGREQLGPREEAERRLHAVRAYRAEPDWFVVGFTPAGEAAGYVVPGWTDSVAMVGEIGVAAAHRGRGYVDELLAWATRRLLEADASRIIADTDCANAPMRAAFRRGGYVEYRWRDDYLWEP